MPALNPSTPSGIRLGRTLPQSIKCVLRQHPPSRAPRHVSWSGGRTAAALLSLVRITACQGFAASRPPAAALDRLRATSVQVLASPDRGAAWPHDTRAELEGSRASRMGACLNGISPLTPTAGARPAVAITWPRGIPAHRPPTSTYRHAPLSGHSDLSRPRYKLAAQTAMAAVTKITTRAGTLGPPQPYTPPRTAQGAR